MTNQEINIKIGRLRGVAIPTDRIGDAAMECYFLKYVLPKYATDLNVIADLYCHIHPKVCASAIAILRETAREKDTFSELLTARDYAIAYLKAVGEYDTPVYWKPIVQI